LMYEDCYFAKVESMASAILVLFHVSVAYVVTLTFHFNTAAGSASATASLEFVISPGGHSRWHFSRHLQAKPLYTRAHIMRHTRRSSHSPARTPGPVDEPSTAALNDFNGIAHQRHVRRAALVDVEGDIKKIMSEDAEVQHFETQDTKTENGKPEHVNAGDAEEVQGGPNGTLFLQHASKAVENKTQHIPSCSTNTGKQCTFPFVYAGQTYVTCTKKKHSRWWCSTKTSAGNHYIQGEWDNCASDCYNCAFGSWRRWTQCSETCGSGGMQTRTRAVVRAAIDSGSCNMAQSSEKKPCTVRKCPRDCEWKSWGGLESM